MSDDNNFTMEKLRQAMARIKMIPKADTPDYVVEWDGEMLEYRSVPKAVVEEVGFRIQAYLVSGAAYDQIVSAHNELKAMTTGASLPSLIGIEVFPLPEVHRESLVLKLAPYLSCRRPRRK